MDSSSDEDHHADRTREDPFHLRSRCLRDSCPLGRGIVFNTRISPSPSKSRLGTRKRTILPPASSVVRKIDFEPSLSEEETHLQERFSYVTRRSVNKATKNDARTKERRVTRSKKTKESQNGPILMSSTLHNDKDDLFIPATAFFAAEDNRDRLTSDYFSGSDTPSKLKESTRRLTNSKTHNNYIAYSSEEELDDWWEQPKTDYTYSASITYRDNVTPERRVGSPNMSRRGLGSGKGGVLTTPPFSQSFNFLPPVNSLSLRSRNVRRSKLNAFSDDDSDGEASGSFSIKTKKSSRSVRESHVKSSFSSRTNIEYGLDTEDVQSVQESPKSKFARPVIRRSLISSIASERPITRSSKRLTRTTETSLQNGNPTRSVSERVAAPLSYVATRVGGHLRKFSKSIVNSSYQSVSKVKSISIVVYTYLLWCLSSTFTRIRSVSSTSNTASLNGGNVPLANHSESHDVNGATVTKTTNVTTYTRRVMTWYEEKKKRNPCLWWWIPLLLLSLLVLLSCVHLVPRTESVKSSDFSNSVSYLIPSPESVQNILSNIFSVIRTGIDSFLDVICSGLAWFWRLIVYGWQSIVSGISWMLSFLYDPSDVLKGVLSPLKSFVNLVLIYAWTGISGLWYALVSIPFAIFNGLAWVFGSISSGSKLGQPKVDEILTSSDSLSGLKISTEELVKLVVSSPELQRIVTDSLRAQREKEESDKESLEVKMKATMETELEELRSQIAGFARGSDVSSEISGLKMQQELIQKQILEINSLLESLKDVQNTNAESSTESLNRLKQSITDSIEGLTFKLNAFQNEYVGLSAKVKACCSETPLTLERVEEHLVYLLSDLVGVTPKDEAQNVLSSKLGSWMDTYFVAKSDLESKLTQLWSDVNVESGKSAGATKIDDVAKQTTEQIMNEVLEKLKIEMVNYQNELNGQLSDLKKLNDEMETKISSFKGEYQTSSASGVDENKVQKIVKDALIKYDADKTGLVDHALESAGGTVVSTRCTEDYQGHLQDIYFFGIPFFRVPANSPRTLLQPNRMPGQCYAFKGSLGYIVVQLAGPVKVSSFSIEHIPKSLSPTGRIDSAPKGFSVYGLHDVSDEGFHFGSFTFDENGETIQQFPVTNNSNEFFQYVELKITSNQGNMNYTCLYRFRVHGIRE